MNNLNKTITPLEEHPIRMMQFGEGNFLRAFVDYMVDMANNKQITDLGVAIVKPIEMGNLDRFHKQDNLFTVCFRGRQDGEVVSTSHVVKSVQKAIDPFVNLDEYEALIKLDTLEFVVSNTTEAGIVFDNTDDISLPLPKSFPGKLTKLLYQRYSHFSGADDKGLVMIPVELIERNGDNLKECVLKLIDLWSLDDNFKTWVLEHNVFANTLVDRIVTGYPREEAPAIFEEIGYEDDLLVAAEPFGLWVIESETDISDRLPLDKAGLPVVFTNNQTPYRERKVRILNGGHTSMVLGAYLAGETIVRSCMDNSVIRGYLESILNNEIIPTLTLPKEELLAFSASVIERFENPFIDHALLDISLNSVSKWKARVLPSFRDYLKNTGTLPPHMAFSLAALIAFYKGSELRDGALIGHRNEEEYRIVDSADVLAFFAEYSAKPASELVPMVLSNTSFWGEDLTAHQGFATLVTTYLEQINTIGALATMTKL